MPLRRHPIFFAVVKGVVDEILAIDELILFQVFNAFKPQLLVLGEVESVELEALHLKT